MFFVLVPHSLSCYGWLKMFSGMSTYNKDRCCFSNLTVHGVLLKSVVFGSHQCSHLGFYFGGIHFSPCSTVDEVLVTRAEDTCIWCTCLNNLFRKPNLSYIRLPLKALRLTRLVGGDLPTWDIFRALRAIAEGEGNGFTSIVIGVIKKRQWLE